MEGREFQPMMRRQTIMGCSKCKVNLCSEACFAAFDHIHRCSRHELVVQFARVQSSVGLPTELQQTRVPVDSPATEAGPSRRGRSGGADDLAAGVGVEPARGGRGGARKGAGRSNAPKKPTETDESD